MAQTNGLRSAAARAPATIANGGAAQVFEIPLSAWHRQDDRKNVLPGNRVESGCGPPFPAPFQMFVCRMPRFFYLAITVVARVFEYAGRKNQKSPGRPPGRSW